MWECREKESCEIFPTGLPFDRDLKSLDAHSEDDHEHQTAGEFDGGLSWNWHRVVLHYSGRELTRGADKEAAISGVTTLMEGKLNDTCIAGLWKRNLPFELLWSVGNNETSRPAEYRAPSWSWFSIDGTVSTRVISSNIIWRRFFTVVEDIQIYRTETGPLAPIKDGYIQLRGCLREAAWEYRPNEDLQHVLILNGTRMSTSHGYCAADVLKQTAPEKVWCLIIELSLNQETISENTVLSVRGLVLRQLQNDTKNFERIGTFHIDGEKALEALFKPFLEARSFPQGKLDSLDIKTDVQLDDSYKLHASMTQPKDDCRTSFNFSSAAEIHDDNTLISDFSEDPSLQDSSVLTDPVELAHRGKLCDLFETLRMKDLETATLTII